MNHPDLTQFARKRLRELDLTPPLDLDALREAIGRERGRTVHLVPTTDIPLGSAYAVTGGDEYNDVVLYDARAREPHQLLLVLHEFAHMLLGHPRVAISHYRADQFQQIDAATVATTLGADPPVRDDSPRRPWSARRLRRAGDTTTPTFYRDGIERDAETLATIMLGWIPGQAGTIRARPTSPLGAVLDELGEW